MFKKRPPIEAAPVDASPVINYVSDPHIMNANFAPKPDGSQEMILGPWRRINIPAPVAEIIPVPEQSDPSTPLAS